MSNWLYTYDGETERVQIGGTELVDGDAEHTIGRLRIHTSGGKRKRTRTRRRAGMSPARRAYTRTRIQRANRRKGGFKKPSWW